jgi:hypothetical protein
MVTNQILLEGEELKQIKDFPYYYISNYGRCFSNYKSKRWGNKFKLISQRNHPTGYKYLGLYTRDDSGKVIRKWLRVHRLVYHHFKGSIAKLLVVDHKDENKSNNHIDNLQLLTISANVIKSHNYKKLNRV